MTIHLKKLIIGIICLTLAILAGVTAWLGITRNLPADGPMKGNILAYHPPFPNHGLLMVVLIALSLLLLIIGIVFTVVAFREPY